MRLHIGDNFASLMYRIMYGTYAPQTKQTVHFLHIGKTGGTAIKHILKRHSVTRGYVIRRHGHRTTLREVSAGEKVIFFVRDPLSRFISGFYSRLRQGQPRYFNPWTPEERMAFERFDTPNRLAVSLSSEDEEQRRSAQKAMHDIGHVRDSYSRWLESENYFLSRLPDIFFIGFQESLAEDFETLKSKLGLPKRLELPTDDVNAHRNPRHLDKDLDPLAVENLTNWYSEDIKFFAVCRHYAKSINDRSEIWT